MFHSWWKALDIFVSGGVIKRYHVAAVKTLDRPAWGVLFLFKFSQMLHKWCCNNET